ncbi:MAG: hypothetical protein HC837_02445 [Chloroflexaceae bacterium]|nr:hypothetical protein [Chloroflexaceae bacterium]
MACNNQPATPANDAASGATAPADTPSRSTLRFGFGNRFLTWDPHQEQRPVTLMGYQLVYDALLTEDSTGQLLPGLAIEWAQQIDTVELTLREGVVFHDGTPFDAEVARANLLHARNEGAPAIAQQLLAVDSIDVLDPYRIRLNLAAPVPDLLSNLARSAGMMISPEAFATAAEQPVGTGPGFLMPMSQHQMCNMSLMLFPISGIRSNRVSNVLCYWYCPMLRHG